MKRTVIVLAASVALLAAAAPAMAAKDYNFKILAAASYVTPLSDTQDAGDTIEAASAVGWEIGAEWRLSGLLGFELDYLDVQHDVDANGETVAEIGVNPINLSANFHLIQGKTIDFWVGPTAAFVSFDIDEVDNVDDEATFGAVAGLDIGLGEKFAIVGGLRYLALDVTPEDTDGISVDPLFARLGVAFRF